jgi:biopolymer transport protein ExbD
MKNFRSSPEVNAGSMADIAFLLLIFFLVSTTIPQDKGIARMLPQECPPGQPCSEKMNERNMLMISANAVGDLYVNKELMEMKDLQETIIKFIDNNGDKTCDYCNGDKDIAASDNPNLAAILIDVQAAAPYRHFISIQDEITKSYEVLRTKYAKEILNKNPDELTAVELKQVKEAYPFRISEAAVD